MQIILLVKKTYLNKNIENLLEIPFQRIYSLKIFN